MTLSPVLAPDERLNTSSGDDLDHTYCECDPDVALCGADVSDAPVIVEPLNPCVVCEDLDPLPCERCGA